MVEGTVYNLLFRKKISILKKKRTGEGVEEIKKKKTFLYILNWVYWMSFSLCELTPRCRLLTGLWGAGKRKVIQGNANKSNCIFFFFSFLPPPPSPHNFNLFLFPWCLLFFSLPPIPTFFFYGNTWGLYTYKEWKRWKIHAPTWLT